MPFFGKRKGSLQSDWFKLLGGAPDLPAGNMYEVALCDDHVLISAPAGRAKLKYSQILSVDYGARASDAQGIGTALERAAVGGALFGATGAAVGAASAIGKKGRPAKSQPALTIGYRSSAGEVRTLVFGDTRRWRGRAVADKLREQCGIDPPDRAEPKGEYL